MFRPRVEYSIGGMGLDAKVGDIMRVLIFIVVVVVIFAGITILAAPYFISTDSMQAWVQDTIKNETGRELKISGKTSFSVFPQIGIEANNVSISNAPGFGSAPFASMRKLQIRLDLIPLLTGKVSVDRFVLLEPEINLAVDAKGKTNWDFSHGKRSRDGGGDDGLTDLTLGVFDISGGVINYTNAQTKEKATLSDINLKLVMPNLSRPLDATGSLVWNKEKVELSARLSTPRLLFSGKQATLKANLSAPRLTVDFSGTLTQGKGNGLAGKLKLTTPSARKLAQWLGNPLAPGRGLGRLNIDADIVSKDDQIALENAKISLDGMAARGTAKLRFGKPRPFLKANFALDKLDLNQYVTGKGKTGRKKRGGAQWNTARIDFSGLKAIDADLTLKTKRIEYKKIATGSGTLTVAMRGGLVVAELKQLALYNGTAKGSLTLDGRAAVPSLKAVGAVANVDGLPLLRAAAGFAKIKGKVNLSFNVTSAGTSQQQMMEKLDGRAEYKFTKGAILGINIAQKLRNAASAIQTGWSGPASNNTPFHTLSASFTFKNGKGTNKNLALVGPSVRITGGGTVNMPKQTLSYRIHPKLVGRSGGIVDFNVAIIISGPWSNPRIYPDIPGILTNPVEAFKKFPVLGGVVSKSVEGIGGLIKSVIPGSGGSSGSTSSNPVNEVGKAFKKLF